MNWLVKMIGLAALAIFVCAPLALAVKTGGAQTPPKSGEVVAGELGARLDQYLTRLAAYGFSGAVLIAKDSVVVLHKGYGLADIDKGIPNTTGTVFDVASITKQFTAAAILKLEMEGKLRSSDAIGRYLP